MNNKQALINVLNRLTAPIEKHTIQFFNNSNPANPDNKPKTSMDSIKQSRWNSHTKTSSKLFRNNA